MGEGVSILVGDCRETLRTLDAGSAQTCVTSPPYWGLRDYGVAGQLGLESTPETYVANLVEVFREVRRVLADDGTLWLNLGDSYAGAAGGGQGKNGQRATRSFTAKIGLEKRGVALKPKDLVGIPWMVAFALRADGWYLRADIVWHKPNPMPESVTDRPTRSHEFVFLLAKAERYYYDADAIRERHRTAADARNRPGRTIERARNVGGRGDDLARPLGPTWPSHGRNKRDVWTIAARPYPGAHFATFPPAIVTPCVLAGSRPGDVVLDPFAGTGTVGAGAVAHGRRAVLCELNPDYVAMAKDRIGRGIRVSRARPSAPDARQLDLLERLVANG